jgi:hypothetical protein
MNVSNFATRTLRLLIAVVAGFSVMVISIDVHLRFVGVTQADAGYRSAGQK